MSRNVIWLQRTATKALKLGVTSAEQFITKLIFQKVFLNCIANRVFREFS